jgi:hypothetical protein
LITKKIKKESSNQPPQEQEEKELGLGGYQCDEEYVEHKEWC